MELSKKQCLLLILVTVFMGVMWITGCGQSSPSTEPTWEKIPSDEAEEIAETEGISDYIESESIGNEEPLETEDLTERETYIR